MESHFKTILFIMIIFCISSSYNCSANYIWSNPLLESTITVSSNLTEEYTNDISNPLNLNCESAVLIEQHSGKVLYSYNMHEQLKPASITKLMSIFLIMEAIENGKIAYDTTVPCSEHAASMGGSQIWLDTTEALTVDEMLKAICVVSANDCVTAMAEFLCGNEENFVKMMNEKASELGMNDTTFKNCHGIDEDGHVTSSYDISILSKELLNKYPQIMDYTTIWNDTLRDGKSELVNTNKLVRNYSGCTGLKTGSTSLALFNLSASASRDGLSLIAVVMKSPNSTERFKCATSLLDYGFNNYTYQTFLVKDDIVKSIKVNKGVLSNVNVVAENDCGALIFKNKNIDIEQKVELPDVVSAPVKYGDIIGNASFYLNGENIGSCNLIAHSSIDKINFSSMEHFILNSWFKMLR